MFVKGIFLLVLSKNLKLFTSLLFAPAHESLCNFWVQKQYANMQSVRKLFSLPKGFARYLLQCGSFNKVLYT